MPGTRGSVCGVVVVVRGALVRAEVHGCEQHCETFTRAHREAFPTRACGWVGSRSNLCSAWSVYFTAVSRPRGACVLGID